MSVRLVASLLALSLITCGKSESASETEGRAFYEVPPDASGGHTRTGQACLAAELPKAPFTQNLLVSEPSIVSSETTIAADDTGRVLASWIEVNPTGQIAWARSENGGNSFARGGIVKDDNPQASDPVLAVTKDGAFHLVWISFKVEGASPTNMHVAVARSADKGKTFDAPVIANDANDGTVVDKPWLAASPDGDLALTYLALDQSGASTQIRVRRQTDGAGQFSAAVATDTGPALRNFGFPAFAPNGDLYVSYMELGDLSGAGGLEKDDADGSTTNRVVVARQDKGAAAFSQVTQVSPAGSLPVFMPQALAVGPDGTVFVTWIAGEENHSDVFLARSKDRAATFEAPVKVNDDETCATHFRPTLEVDAKGRLHLTWLDNRNGQGNVLYATSEDGGQTFKSSRLGDAPFSFRIGREPLETWLGDYNDLAIGQGKLFAIWGDPRSGKTGAFVSSRDLP